jgi:hypothetical protein
MRLALLIALMFAPLAAHADPVTAAVAAFAAWAGTTVATVYLVGATIMLSAGVSIYGAAQARRAERQARDARNAGMQDRMTNRIASEAPHRTIYGRAKVGSDIVAMFTSGDRDQYKHIVCVLATHECDAIEEVYVNNEPVGLLTSFGDVTTGRHATGSNTEIMEEVHTGFVMTTSRFPLPGSVQVFVGGSAHMAQIEVTSVVGRTVTVPSPIAGPFLVSYEYSLGRRFGEDVDEEISTPVTPTVRVQRHLGAPGDSADAYLMSVVPDKWASTSVLRGLTYLVVTLDLNNPEFQNGQVPIHALVRGKKLYDPRTGLTGWSCNPALAIYDYLTSPLCGVAAADLPVAQFITAANVCDEAVLASGAARYTINGTVTSDQAQSSVLESMAQCMAGGIVSTTWDISAGKYVAPVLALDQSDIVGSLSITPGASDAAIFNGVKGQFISNENSYVLTDFAPFQNPAYLAADGRDLYTDIPFPFTDSLQRVHNLARIFTEDQRNGFTMKADFSLKAWPIKVGQRVAFTSAFLGQTAKVYRVTDKSYSPNSPVQLTLKEDAASIWDFADAAEVDSTPNTDLPDPWAIAPLASITCTSGQATLLTQADGTLVPRILASWPAATTQAVFTNGQIEIEWRAVSTTTWSKMIVSGSDTQAYLSPITPGWFYVVRARCVNPYLNTKSDWVYATYQVTVFTANPTVYQWSSSRPAVPAGAASYDWATQAFGAAPAGGWSLLEPEPPTGGAVTLWSARVLVKDLNEGGATPFDWASAIVASIGYAAAPAPEGSIGSRAGMAYLYMWATTAPATPTGTSTFTWSSGANSAYSAGDGWAVAAPSNPGTPLVRLYVASVGVAAAGTAVTTTVSYGGAGVVAWSQNGSNGTPGVQATDAVVYQWALTIPSGPVGSPTYTWSTKSFGAAPSGWSLTPGTSTPGYTLWAAKVALADSTTATTTSFNWSGASIAAAGYAGTNGSSSTGAAGSSYKAAYCASSTASTTTAPAATTGSTSVPAVNGGGIAGTWSSTVPTLTSGQFLYQSDGIYNPSTNQITWSIPYWSSLKVGSLSAISANLGAVTAGSIVGLTITGGTITGTTIQSAASGDRVMIDATTNRLKVFSGSTAVVELGGTSGTVYVPSLATTSPAIFATNSTNSVPTISATNIGSNAGVDGSSTAGFGGKFQSSGSNPGLYAKNTATGHGARIQGGQSGNITCSAVIALSDGTNRTFYNETGVFGPFTGSHDAAIDKTEPVEIGDIVVDVECLARAGVNNTFFRVTPSTIANQLAVSGVVNARLPMAGLSVPAAFIASADPESGMPVACAEWSNVQTTYDYIGMNALGEGQINICGEGGDIAAGDLIVSSSTAGKGMRQEDNVVRSNTVAKAREAVSFSNPSEVRQMACFYLAG